MKIKCNTCDTENSPEDEVCGHCMAIISRADSAEKDENVEKPKPETSVAKRVKICRVCGMENPPTGVLRCRNRICRADISRIRPIEKTDKPEPDVEEEIETGETRDKYLALAAAAPFRGYLPEELTPGGWYRRKRRAR